MANTSRRRVYRNPVFAVVKAAGQGFTLLEVMVALAILAVALAAISYANNAAISQIARITRMTTAAFLMEGVVNDIHAYYQRKGFPSNSLEDKGCELPKDFEGIFDCRYDLKAINLKPDEIQGMVQAGINAAMGMEVPHEKQGEGGKEKTTVFDSSKIAALAWLLSPQGELTRAICRIDPAWIGIGVMGLATYLPQIIDQLSKRTRQLTVRLTWKDGPRKHREFKVQTFIVSLPEEEMAAMRELERQQTEQEAIRSQAPQFQRK